MPTADVSVRLAWSEDVPAIVAIQQRAWATQYAALGDALIPDAEWAGGVWSQAVRRPELARQRILVALDRTQVCGFVLTAPACDPDCSPDQDGEMLDLTVDPRKPDAGHDARLLNAAVDTLKADGFSRAVTWISAEDDELRAMLTDSGWAADGAHRQLDLDEGGTYLVKQIRLHTDIT